jgi:type IV pilus assembly protein PilF
MEVYSICQTRSAVGDVMPLFRSHRGFSPGMNKISILFILLSSFFFAGCAGSNKATKAKAVNMEDMARSLILQGNPRDGLGYLVKASKLDPNNPDIEHEMALVYENIDEYALALQHFKKAISLRPGFSEAVNNMGILYSKMKEWDKALACFQKAVSDVMYNTPHFAYHNMGLVYFYKDDYPNAITNYQKAIKLAPSYVNVYYDLANAYIAQNRFEDAVEIYKKITALNPQSKQADLSLARLYLKMNKQQEAIDELKNIIVSDPRSQTAKDANQVLEDLAKK